MSKAARTEGLMPIYFSTEAAGAFRADHSELNLGRYGQIIRGKGLVHAYWIL